MVSYHAHGIGGGYRKEFHSRTREGRVLGEDDFAEDALRRSGEKMKRPVSIEEITTHLCTRYGLDRASLAYSRKKRNCSEACSMIALLVWYEDHLSLPEIDRHRKHSSKEKTVLCPPRIPSKSKRPARQGSVL